MLLSGPQLKVFVLIYVSYAISLVIKRNYAFWLPDFTREYPHNGSVGSLWELANAVAKVVGGVLVDLHSPTAVLSLCLGLQGVTSALFLVPFMLLGATHPAAAFTASAGLWALNGAANAMLWPALARIFMSWFPDPKQRGVWYSALATSQNVGAGFAPLLTASLAATYGWTARLYAPAALAIAYACLLVWTLTNEPPAAAATSPPSSPALERGRQSRGRAAQGKSVGARARRPSASRSRSSGDSPPTPSTPAPSLARSSSTPPLGGGAVATAVDIIGSVVRSPTMWLLGANYAANSFARNTLTTYCRALTEDADGLALGAGGASASNAAYEAGGAVGGLIAGAISDAVFASRRGPVMALSSLALAVVPLLLTLPIAWDVGRTSAVYFLIGLAAFPPHVLNGLASRELARPDAVSSASGFTKGLGQVGAALGDAFALRLARGAGLRVGGALGFASALGAAMRWPVPAGAVATKLGVSDGWCGLLWLLAAIGVAGSAALVPLWNSTENKWSRTSRALLK